MTAPTLAQVQRAVGIPITNWPGKCSLIASALLEHAQAHPIGAFKDLADGKYIYAHYLGPVHKKSRFHGNLFSHHAWIRVGNTIVDPTRWAFDQPEKPYMHVGPASDPDYDEEQHSAKAFIRQDAPPFNPDDRPCALPTENREALASLCENFLGTDPYQTQNGKVSVGQIFYLANLPPSQLGGSKETLHNWLISVGHESAIPFDYQ